MIPLALRPGIRLGLVLALLGSLSGCRSCDGEGDDDPAPPVPAAPASPAAVALNSGSIQLNWIDASSDEDGFQVERSSDGLTWTEIARPPAGSTGHVSRGLAPLTMYWHRVCAWNTSGASAYAGPAGATTGSVAWAALLATPAGRMQHSAVYDPVAPERMIVFGGFDGLGLPAEVLAFDLAGAGGWTDITPAAGPPAPAPRMGRTAILDVLYNRMIVFGGSSAPGENEVWALNLSPTPTWELLLPGSPLPSTPAPRSGHTAVYDPLNQRMIVFGGFDGAQFLNNTWALSLPLGAGTPAWSPLPLSGTPPLPRHKHAAVYDPAGDRMIVFGGEDNDLPGDGSAFSNECWTLSLPAGGGATTWSYLSAWGPWPAHRERHSMICDSLNQRLIVFGGIDDTYTPLGDLWTLGLSGAPAWTQAAPLGAGPPPPRVSHTAIHDPSTGRMILFGGDDDTFTSFADAWALGL